MNEEKKDNAIILTRLNLFQKLIEVRKSIPYIQKGAKSYNYNYTKESQLLGTIKGQMDSQGVWLDMDMVDTQEVDISIYNEKTKTFIKVPGIKVKFQFTFTDCDNPIDQIVRCMTLQDAGSDVKKIGGLQTYALKYFVMKFFNIANDDLDPDKFEDLIDIKSNDNISLDFEIIKNLIKSTKTDLKKFLDHYEVEKIEDLSKEKYDGALKSLTKKSNGGSNGTEKQRVA